MDYNRYRRYFIILDNEENGFDNKQGKNPKGYTKIEIKNGKGVLSHYIQNLKYFKNAEYIYRGYLIGTKEGQEAFVDNGAFVIDESGKGEITWRFDPANVDGKGNNIDAFNVIAVVAEAAEQHHRGEVAAPLVGFINKERASWKHILSSSWSRKEKSEEEKELDVKYEKKYEKIKEILKDVQKEVPEETIEIVESDETTEHKHEELEIEINIELEEEEVPAPAVEGEVIEEIEEAVEEVKEEKEEIVEKVKKEAVEEMKEVKEEVEEAVEEMQGKAPVEAPKETAVPQPEAMKKEAAPKKPEEIYYQDVVYDPMKHYPQNTTHSYYNNYFKMVCDYVDNILKYHKKVEPFEKNMNGCQWWKVDYDQQTLYRSFLPFYGYVNNMYGYYPHMNYMAGYPDLMYKYQHYIFGKKCDEKGEPVFYLYGMPGRYLAAEQPYEGMTGFVYWHPIEDREPQKGDYGYWILHVDAKTGSIVMPLKPTPPPNY
ncbi:hypothetical protein [Anaerosolibacter sp.]|uniref:DUF7922 domain-containing protein n=1 Tax=Anaerosolibacter sp. TaxID=1872527 RepID=UPI0039EDF0EB